MHAIFALWSFAFLSHKANIVMMIKSTVYWWLPLYSFHSEDMHTATQEVCFYSRVSWKPKLRKGQSFEWNSWTAVQINWEQLTSRCFDYHADRSFTLTWLWSSSEYAENTIKRCFSKLMTCKCLNKKTWKKSRMK